MTWYMKLDVDFLVIYFVLLKGYQIWSFLTSKVYYFLKKKTTLTYTTMGEYLEFNKLWQ